MVLIEDRRMVWQMLKPGCRKRRDGEPVRCLRWKVRDFKARRQPLRNGDKTEPYIPCRQPGFQKFETRLEQRAPGDFRRRAGQRRVPHRRLLSCHRRRGTRTGWSLSYPLVVALSRSPCVPALAKTSRGSPARRTLPVRHGRSLREGFPTSYCCKEDSRV